MKPHRKPASPEPLEARIAPAVAISAIAQLPVGVEPGHAVDVFQSKDAIADLNSALDLITNPSRQQSAVHDDGVGTINYSHSDSPPQNFFENRGWTDIPGHHLTPSGPDKKFVMRSEGFLHIPAAGTWTFSVLSEDSFRLRMGDKGAVVSEFEGARTSNATNVEITVAGPGYYPYELVYLDRANLATVEFSATGPGQSTAKLVGDPTGLIKVFHGDGLVNPDPRRLVPTAPGHNVTFYKSTGQVTSLADAFTLTGSPNPQFALTDHGVAVINYKDDENSGGGGNVGNDRDLNAIPGSQFNATGDDDDYALEAGGWLYLPTAGEYGFTVNSADGFRLKISGWEVASHATGNAGNQHGVFSVSAPGYYFYDLLAFERDGASHFEFTARAPGQEANGFVGDTAHGGIGVFQNVVPETADVPTLNLGLLSGKNGFKISGESDYDSAGQSVSAAGDINGDGFADVIIGAFGAGLFSNSIGAAYVVFGNARGFAASTALSALDGSNGFKLSGVSNSDYTGISVSAAGDVNGDGFDDVIIGAAYADEGGDNKGAAYVVFGKAGGFAASMTLAALDGSNGFKLTGVNDDDLVGRSVSEAGDVNGDGFADLIIGAPGADEGGSDRGAAYVFFGKGGGFGPSLPLGALSGADGFKFSGSANFDKAGFSVSGAGDVNGDDFADFIIGARDANEGGMNRGAAYVVFGKAGGFGPSFAVGALGDGGGFKLSGSADYDSAGRSVSGAGDVNGDGFDDLIIGAPFANEAGTDRGASYVVFGKAGGFGSSVALGALSGADGFKLSGSVNEDGAGVSVNEAGDVNDDGFDDLIIGASGADEAGFNSGAAYVVFGRPTEVAVTASPTVKLAPFTFTQKSFAYTDVDGDLVTVKITKGLFGPSAAYASNFTLHKAGLGARLALLDISGDPLAFKGTNITITAKPQKIGGVPRGDGRADVGFIDAGGTALGAVTVPGTLGGIKAGDGIAGIKSFTVGALGGGLQLAESSIFGGIGALTVKGGFSAARLLAGSIGKVSIGGSLRAGGVDGTGIFSTGTIGGIAIKGGIFGDAAHRVEISALGTLLPATAVKAVALKTLTVGTDVEHARISVGGKFNPDAQIGVVTVGGDWLASDFAAGAGTGVGNRFGDTNDALLPYGNNIASRIAAITIKGSILSTPDNTDHFGFIAQEIASFKIGAYKLPLLIGPGNDSASLVGDTRLRELAVI